MGDGIIKIPLVIVVADQLDGVTCRLHPESRARIAVQMRVGDIPTSVFLGELTHEHLEAMPHTRTAVATILTGMNETELAAHNGCVFRSAR